MNISLESVTDYPYDNIDIELPQNAGTKVN